jgi:thiamine biosynthesis lipoprotein
MVAALLFACGESRQPETELSGSSMGTFYSVKIVSPPPAVDTTGLERDVGTVLADVEQSMSTYLTGSELSIFNTSRSTAWQSVSAELCNAVAEALSIAALTGGAFDITVGPLVNLWGFGPEDIRLEPPAQSDIEEAKRRVGYVHLSADCARPALRKDRADVYVDLSAYAKGYAVDRLAGLLEQRQVANYLIELGGELRMLGHNAAGEQWAVAIEMPLPEERRVQRIVHITDTGMATSGDYRNFFEYKGRRFSHLIDARTGRPVTHALSSVTVVSPRASTADALATALLVMGPDEGVDFAVREEIAGLFLLQGESGLTEYMTPAFAAMAALAPNGDRS